jgi:hypothetical protein
MRGGDDPGGEALRLRARILLAQLREVQALLQPGELLESGPERLVMAAKLGADPVRLEIDMTNFMARGEPFIQTSGRNVGAVMHSRSYAQEASNAGEAELSLVEFVRAFREFFTVEVQRRTERQSEPPGVLLTLQPEMDVACHFLFGDASKLLGTPPGALPLRRSREADPPPGGDGRASGRIPLRLLGKDGARGTMDLRLDAGVSAQAGDDLGADVRFTVTTGYPRSPVRVEALAAMRGGEGQRKFILALVGQAQAVARIQAATAEGQRHVAVLIQGLFTRILHLSRKCNLCKCPLRPQGEGEAEADTVPGRAAAKGWAPLHGLGITQVRCGAFFHEECLRATFRRACREGADTKCPCIMPASALFPERKCNENLGPHRLRGS